MLKSRILAAAVAVPLLLASSMPAHAAEVTPPATVSTDDASASAGEPGVFTPGPEHEGQYTVIDEFTVYDKVFGYERQTKLIDDRGVVAYSSEFFSREAVESMPRDWWLVVDGVGASVPVYDGDSLIGQLNAGQVVSAGPALSTTTLDNSSAWEVPVTMPSGKTGWVGNNALDFDMWPASPELTETLTLTSDTPVHSGPSSVRMDLIGTLEEGREVQVGDRITMAGSLLGRDEVWVPVGMDDGTIGWMQDTGILADPGAVADVPGARGDDDIEADDGETSSEAAEDEAPATDAQDEEPAVEPEDSPGFPIWLIPAGIAALIAGWLILSKRKGKQAEAQNDTEAAAPAMFQEDDEDQDFDPWGEAATAEQPQLEPEPDPEPVDDPWAPDQPEPEKDDIDWDDEPVRPIRTRIDTELEIF